MKYLVYWKCTSTLGRDREGTTVVCVPSPIRCEDDLQVIKDFLITTSDFRPFEHCMRVLSFSRFEE